MIPSGNKYIVLECKGYQCLTVGNRVLKPGDMFFESEFTWGTESLQKAIAKKRCKLVSGTKKVVTNDSK